MGYTYDHRPGKVASDKSEKKKVEALFELLDDSITSAEAIVSELGKSFDTDLHDASKIADDLLGDLQNCADVETIKNFVSNLHEVQRYMGLLEPALKKAKKDAKAEDDTAAIEAIEEAMDALKDLKRELKSVEAKIESPDEDDEEDDDSEDESEE
jgi:hypothetical protein